MESLVQILLTIFSSVLASSGLWAYLMKKNENKDVKTKMLIGLGHDRIMYLGMHYLERRDENGEAYITRDEYENLNDYLYKPYKEIGGNGSAERIMKEVDKLPIREHHQK
jgi:site-specific recombinase